MFLLKNKVNDSRQTMSMLNSVLHSYPHTFSTLFMHIYKRFIQVFTGIVGFIFLVVFQMRERISNLPKASSSSLDTCYTTHSVPPTRNLRGQTDLPPPFIFVNKSINSHLINSISKTFLIAPKVSFHSRCQCCYSPIKLCPWIPHSAW